MKTGVRFAGALLGFALALTAATGHAQWRPTRPIHMIMPLAAGGAGEAILRSVTEPLQARLGQPIIIEPRPGGGQWIGADAVLKAAPDGQYVLWASTSLMTFPMLSGSRQDMMKSFLPVVHIGDTVMLLAVNSDLPVNSVADLVKYAKANPGKVNYGYFGNGSPQNIAGEIIKSRAGIDMVPVPYKGSALLLPDLLAGRVQVAIDAITTLKPHVDSGRIRILGITNGARSQLMPGVPALSDSFPNFHIAPWNGFFVAMGTPRDIITTLNQETNAVLQVQGFAEQLGRVAGGIPRGGSPEQFAELLRQDAAQYSQIISSLGLKAD
jgi:tripartite-type tricarboxylate transporter receptor subunit TctC